MSFNVTVPKIKDSVAFEDTDLDLEEFVVPT